LHHNSVTPARPAGLRPVVWYRRRRLQWWLSCTVLSTSKRK
jgi:hypothetical protein